ncbi:hypothetical protein RHMOL_Rhmol11G0043900 [Rhododendron molle]|uniref:Uncharacterized protein n=1 Tax=Rhododendron molle TaxID=49168 RepID=A0ACC0LNJ3_RHOML|nr:hypothetical protein RHMOL_Rhmol11G0043900 [Rhododendron molle]
MPSMGSSEPCPRLKTLRCGACDKEDAPFTPRVLADYRSLLAPEYMGPISPPEENLELYEVSISCEVPPPAVTPEYLPPTEVITLPIEDLELPFELETDPELEATILNLSQYYLEPLEEPPISTIEKLLAQKCEYLLRIETVTERNYNKWLREIHGINLP